MGRFLRYVGGGRGGGGRGRQPLQVGHLGQGQAQRRGRAAAVGGREFGEEGGHLGVQPARRPEGQSLRRRQQGVVAQLLDQPAGDQGRPVVGGGPEARACGLAG